MTPIHMTTFAAPCPMCGRAKTTWNGLPYQKEISQQGKDSRQFTGITKVYIFPFLHIPIHCTIKRNYTNCNSISGPYYKEITYCAVKQFNVHDQVLFSVEHWTQI